MRLDAAGKACPIPVIMAKKELDNGTQDLSILVDGQTQIDNLSRLGKTYGREITVTPEGEKFVATFADGDGNIPESAHGFDEGSYAVFFNKEGLGSGDAELGMNLAKMAIFTLSESENIPTYVLFMNGGVMEGELYEDIAPKTVENFESLIEKKFYDGLIFHRVIPGFMIQGGCPNGNGMGGPGYTIPGEFNSNGFKNDLKHTRGVLSMARAMDPNSGGSQFFIMVADAPHLDGDYAAFGKITKGMEVADAIVNTKRDPWMDKPLEDQKIKSIRMK